MTPRVVTVLPTTPVPVAVERMTRYGFSALPVVDAKYKLVGIVSLIDILRYRELHGSDDDVPIEAVMNPDPLFTKPMVNPAAVGNRMRTNGALRVMPVVDSGRLVGIVTRSDLLQPRSQHGRMARILRRISGKDSAYKEVLIGLTSTQRTGPTADAEASIREIMTTVLVTVGTAQPAMDAADLLLQHRFTALPVVDEQARLLGVISEADLLADPHAGRRATRTVGSVMTRNPVVVSAGATVGAVRSLVADRGLRMVPVVADGKVVGVISRSDLV